MLLNFLWFGLIFLSLASDLLTGTPFSSGMAGLGGARAGLELALTLAGPVCLWSGLSQASVSGVRGRRRRLLEPVRQSERESAGTRERGDAARHPGSAAHAGAVRRKSGVGRDVPACRDEYGFLATDPVDGRRCPCAARRGACV